MKLRIISGSLKGRLFNPPHGHKTHPMGDRVRSALFNTLGDIQRLSVLDAFAGSGALAFEALSRGASHALLIDSDTEAIKAINESAEALNLTEQVQVIQGNVNGWSNNHHLTFDLVFCDPPYDAVPSTLIVKLSKHVAPSGTLVLSWPSFVELPKLSGLELLSSKQYGNASLAFYKKTG